MAHLLYNIPSSEDRDALAREFISIAKAAGESRAPALPHSPKSPALLFRDELEELLRNLARR